MSRSDLRHEKEQEMGFEMKGRAISDVDYDWSTFKLLRRMRDVRRLSGFHLTRAYSDAEHCYYTGLLFLALAKQEDVEISVDAVAWVLAHDAMEVVTGDLLYPAKHTSPDTKFAWNTIEKEIERAVPAMRGYSDDSGRAILGERAWALFKDCDSLELWLFCVEERHLGNVPTNIDGSTVEATMYQLLVKSQFPTIRSAVGCQR